LVEDSTELIGNSSKASVVDPVQLANFLNSKQDFSDGSTEKNLDFLLEKFEREGIDGYFYYVQAMENFGKFIENLSPQLRTQFLEGVFKNYENRRPSVEKVLNRFSSKAILQILNDINSDNLAVSQTVVSLLGNLSQNSAIDSLDKQALFDSKIEDKLKSLFKEDINEQFLNDDYQKTLDALVNHEHRASAEILKEIPNPQEELSPHKIELQVGKVVLELLNSANDEESQEEIKNNILQSVNYFLETSDFSAIQNIHARLTENLSKAEGGSVDFFQDLLGLFEQPDFMEEVLAGLNIWGKEKLDGIQTLIETVGYPFTMPLLDRLAEETKRTTRRFLLEQLYRVAPKGPISPVLKRLNDNRWFVVRNLVLLLRTIGDPSALKSLERIVDSSHPKVRFEVIKTFLHFQHPLGIKFLLEDLQSTEQEIRFNAIVLAEHCQAPAVFHKLLELLRKKGFNNVDLDDKKQIVKTLGTIKNPAALPVLKKILASFSLFNAGKNSELKKEITRSLPNYPGNATKEIIRQITSSGNEELAEAAENLETHF
jgi:HEAT repeat protein